MERQVVCVADEMLPITTSSAREITWCSRLDGAYVKPLRTYVRTYIYCTVVWYDSIMYYNTEHALTTLTLEWRIQYCSERLMNNHASCGSFRNEKCIPRDALNGDTFVL